MEDRGGEVLENGARFQTAPFSSARFLADYLLEGSGDTGRRHRVKDSLQQALRSCQRKNSF